jgi:hypothetical protein
MGHIWKSWLKRCGRTWAERFELVSQLKRLERPVPLGLASYWHGRGYRLRCGARSLINFTLLRFFSWEQ